MENTVITRLWYIPLVLIILFGFHSLFKNRVGSKVSITESFVRALFWIAARTTGIAHASESYILCYREITKDEMRKVARRELFREKEEDPIYSAASYKKNKQSGFECQ